MHLTSRVVHIGRVEYLKKCLYPLQLSCRCYVYVYISMPLLMQIYIDCIPDRDAHRVAAFGTVAPVLGLACSPSDLLPRLFSLMLLREGAWARA